MMLPDWLIYKKRDSNGELQIRKIGNGDAGIEVTRVLYDFPGSVTVSAEFFINKEEARELIEALREYFDIKD